MDRRSYYFAQEVTDEELNEGFDGCENADRNLASDLGYFGIIAGAVVVQHAAVANLTVDVSGAGILYDQIGERIFWPSTQNVDVSHDFNSVSTAVAGAGNEKWVSVFAQFERVLSDPRVDGNSDTVYFDQAEGFGFYVTQGAEAAIGLAARPSFQSAMVLLADVNMRHSEVAVLDGSIDTTRRQDAIVISGSPLSIRRGEVLDALGDVVTEINSLAASSATLATAIAEVKGEYKCIGRYRVAPGAPGAALANWSDTAYNPAHDYVFQIWDIPIAFAAGDRVNVRVSAQVATAATLDQFFLKLRKSLDGGAVTDLVDNVAAVNVVWDNLNAAGATVMMPVESESTLAGAVATSVEIWVSMFSAGGTTCSLMANSSLTIEVWRPTP